MNKFLYGIVVFHISVFSITTYFQLESLTEHTKFLQYWGVVKKNRIDQLEQRITGLRSMDVLPIKPRPVLMTIDKRIRIAVLDTGIKDLDMFNNVLCNDGNINYSTNDSSDIKDTHGHGTMIVSILSRTINIKTHCVEVIKLYNGAQMISTYNNIISVMGEHLIHTNVKFLNFSASGTIYSPQEEALFKLLTDNGVQITVSAGNNGKDLNNGCSYYPACNEIKSSNFHVVGALNNDGTINKNLNYNGPVKDYEATSVIIGKLVYSGTSVSSAIHMSKLINKSKNVTK